MKFTCPRCGKKYASADEPAPGRVYSLTCRCGTKITVKGPEGRPTDAPEPAPAPAAPRGFDPFPSERRRTQGGAPVSSVDTGSLPVSRPGEPTPSSSWSTQTQRVPLKEATPAPFPVPARPVPAAPAPRAAPAAARAPAAPRPAPTLPRAAPRPAAPLDPFADMPDLQREARGEARPLTSVPEIRGPVPEPPAPPGSYDPFAAQHGLLLDQREARAIAGQAPVLEPRVEPGASEEDESAVTFSQEMPAAPKRRARAVVPRVASRGRGRLVAAVAAVAVVGAGAAAAWFFLGRTRSTPPAQAVARPAPSGPAPALGSPPIPAPAPPPVAPAPQAAAPVAAAPAQPPPVPAAAPPASPPRAEPRPEPRREAPRKAEPKRAPRQERQVAAAPDPPPRREPAREEPPPPPPKVEEPPRKPAADKSVLDLMARKQDSGPSAAPGGGAVRGELTSAEVGAAIKASAKAFDACVSEAVRNEPTLQVVGRRVGLYITVNPSGLVTGPRLDDQDLDDSVLGACLKATARKMTFPAFQGEAFQVRIPMVLGGGR